MIPFKRWRDARETNFPNLWPLLPPPSLAAAGLPAADRRAQVARLPVAPDDSAADRRMHGRGRRGLSHRGAAGAGAGRRVRAGALLSLRGAIRRAEPRRHAGARTDPPGPAAPVPDRPEEEEPRALRAAGQPGRGKGGRAGVLRRDLLCGQPGAGRVHARLHAEDRLAALAADRGDLSPVRAGDEADGAARGARRGGRHRGGGKAEHPDRRALHGRRGDPLDGRASVLQRACEGRAVRPLSRYRAPQLAG